MQRMTAFVVALGLAAPAWAQQAAAPATPPPDPAKQQVLMFEVGLRNAVDMGGAKFAERVAAAYPGVFLSPGADTAVRGVVVREVGLYMFTVEVPDLSQTGLQVFNWMRQGHAAAPPRPVSSSASGQTVAAAGTVTADPMSVSPVVGSDFDPNREYTANVKAALVEAMVENSRVLPIGEGETLVIIATGRSDRMPSPFARSGARELILSIKAADLAEYRRGAITREEVARRVKETRF